MLFNVMIALAAYYMGRSGMDWQQFTVLLEKLLKLNEGD